MLLEIADANALPRGKGIYKEMRTVDAAASRTAGKVVFADVQGDVQQDQQRERRGRRARTWTSVLFDSARHERQLENLPGQSTSSSTSGHDIRKFPFAQMRSTPDNATTKSSLPGQRIMRYQT